MRHCLNVSFPRKESSDCVALISGSFNAPFYGRSGCDLFDIVQTSVGEEWLASHSRVSVRNVVHPNTNPIMFQRHSSPPPVGGVIHLPYSCP